MKNSRFYKWTGFIFAIILLLSLTACGQIFKRLQENVEGETKKQEKKEVPEVLKKMQENTEKIISEIQKVKDERAKIARQEDDAAQSENEKQGKSNQQESTGEEKKQDSSSEANKGDKEEKKQDKGQSEKQGAQPQVKWPEFEKTIEEFHVLWNDYEVQAKEDGASSEHIKAFEEKLNALTEQIMAHNEEKTLIAANSLYRYFPYFLNLYKHNAPPETEEMKYYIEEILILAQQEKWEETKPLMDDLEKAWLKCKARMEKQDKQVNAKIDAALEDLKEVLPMKNLSLLKFKANILKNNVNDIK